MLVFSRKIVLSIVTSFLLFSALTSCYSYKPAAVISPKFEKEGDVNFGMYLGSNSGASVSYSPIDHLGILADVSIAPEVSDRHEDGEYYNQDERRVYGHEYYNRIFNVALGTFWEYKNGIYHDLYFGFTKGVSSMDDPNLFLLAYTPYELEAFSGDYEGGFIQSSLKFEKENYLLSIDGKLNLLRFRDFDYIYEENPYENQPTNHKSLFNEYFFFKERYVTQLAVSLHKREEFYNIFFQLQLGVGDNHTSDFFTVRPFNYYGGVSIPISKFWRKDKTEPQP